MQACLLGSSAHSPCHTAVMLVALEHGCPFSAAIDRLSPRQIESRGRSFDSSRCRTPCQRQPRHGGCCRFVAVHSRGLELDSCILQTEIVDLSLQIELMPHERRKLRLGVRGRERLGNSGNRAVKRRRRARLLSFF